jgi:16S rRNA (cytidine1402-2'-O)-methyltransferase
MLYLIATPIGNLEDTSTRALDTLRKADVLACEDTRRTLILLTRFDIRRPSITISYRQGNEDRVGQQILDYVAEGKTVAVCSDSGYPGISDPGYRLVRLAVEKGVPFEVIPGASAVPVALLLSGLPTSSFTFKGYPPRKPGPLRSFFAEEKDRPHTLVLFESPYRVGAALQAAAEVLGDREAAVCVELTKKFERVHRGFLVDLAARFEKEEVRGEVTIVVAGDNPKFRRPAP